MEGDIDRGEGLGGRAAVPAPGGRRPDPAWIEPAVQQRRPAALADLGRDRLDPGTAPQGKRGGLPEALEPLASDPDQDQLPLT